MPDSREKVRRAYRPGGLSPTAVWKRAAWIACNRCDYCNRTMSRAACTVDHIVPLIDGSAHNHRNWALACDVCNQKKSRLYLSELGMRLLRKRNKDGAVAVEWATHDLVVSNRRAVGLMPAKG